MRAKAVLFGLLLVFALVPAPVARAASTASPGAVFEEVWQTVRNRFYDPALHGLDWDAVGRRYRPLAAAAKDDAARAAVINAMLGELHASHTGYYTRADTAYYDLADIFSAGLRRQLTDFFPDGEVAYTGIGIFTRQIGGKTFVSGVLDGEPGAQAGLLVGDEILTADGGTFGPVASFDGKAGQRVTLAVRRSRDGAPREIIVVPHRIRPNQTFLDAMRASIRTIESGGRRIGYVHVWFYARDAY